MNFSKEYEILPKAALASLVEDNSKKNARAVDYS